MHPVSMVNHIGELDTAFPGAISGISNKVVSFQLEDHFSTNDGTYDCTMGMLFKGGKIYL